MIGQMKNPLSAPKSQGCSGIPLPAQRNFPAASSSRVVEAGEVTPAAFAALALEVRALFEADEPIASP